MVLVSHIRKLEGNRIYRKHRTIERLSNLYRWWGTPGLVFLFFDRSNPDLVYEQVINYIKIKPNALIEDETTIDQDLKWTRIEYSYDGRTNYSNFLRQHNCVAYFSNQDQKSIFIDFCSDTGVEKKARTVFENIINSVYIETP